MMLEQLPPSVKIVEVGPRDGLQNEKTVLPLEAKAQYIRDLAGAGVGAIEAVSFVRADKIPQMADAEKLYRMIADLAQNPELTLSALVPNSHGLELALKGGVKEIAVFTATSETFNQKNINASIEESLERIQLVCQTAKAQGLRVRGYISTAFGCPYEGVTSVMRLVELVQKLLAMGAYEISVGDTIGVAHPLQVVQIIHELKKRVDLRQLAMHFHDTRGMALANILASLNEGIRTFDSSSGGLGGCPYAKGATGNVATEDVVYLMHSMGIKTGIDMDKLAMASHAILKALGKATTSKFLTSYFATHSLTTTEASTCKS